MKNDEKNDHNAGLAAGGNDTGSSPTETASVRRRVVSARQRPHDMGDDKRAAIYRSLAASYAMVTPPLTAAQIHHLALFGAATVRSLLLELGVLQDMHSRDASQATPDEQNARIYLRLWDHDGLPGPGV